jgi:antitoxin HicB
MTRFRVTLENDEDTVLVKSPDFPELITFGDDEAEALSYAIGAFSEAIAARMAHHEPIPEPSPGKPSDPRVTIPSNIALKARLYQSLLDSGIKKSELARRLNLHRQEIDRLLDVNHVTNIKKIEAAFAVLGKSLRFEVEEAV